jgi:hypothetical protein
MANKLDEQQRAVRVASKQDRERDAAIAMQEYEAEKVAVLARTAKLRAIRLANEAAVQADDQAAKAIADEAAAAKTAAKKPRAVKAVTKTPRAAAKTPRVAATKTAAAKSKLPKG